MALRTIDFETYYAPNYSLSKMQTDEYILDPRFEIILVGLDDKWFSGTHDEIRNFILINSDPVNDTFVAHNAIFDGFILTQILKIFPARWVDTLGMARAVLPELKSHGLAALAKYFGFEDKGTYVVDAKGKHRDDFDLGEMLQYATYCLHDVKLTRALYDRLLPFFPPQELAVLDMTIRMFTEPKLLLDADALDAYHKSEIKRKEDLLAACTADKSELMSNPKFAEKLQDLGVTPPLKISARTGKETFAFAKSDKEFVALLEHENPEVQALVAARLGVKSTIAETRALRLLQTAQRGTGRFPVALNYWGAATTGRLSGGNGINAQNIPARGAGSELRKAIIAPPGHLVVVGDSSNIELRVAMACAGQTDAIDKLRAGEDLYCDFASKIYHREITKDDKPERFLGKVAMLSLQYGAGAPKFREIVRLLAKQVISEEEANRIVWLYREVHSEIHRLWARCDNIVLPAINNGRLDVYVDVNKWFWTVGEGFSHPPLPGVKYTDLRRDQMSGQWSYQTRNGRVGIYGGKCVENLCLEENTLVLTQHGWTRIADISDEHLVHDGIAWVSHGGKVFTGKRQCVTVDGVKLTPDHEVLTNAGWRAALENPQPYRPDLRHVDCAAPRRKRRFQTLLDLSLSMRERSRESWRRCKERSEAWWNTELRVRYETLDERQQQAAWYEQTSSVCGVAQYARSVQATYPPSVAKLRWAWNISLHKMERSFREFLGRHGRYLQERFSIRPCRQQRQLRKEQLSLDYLQRKLLEQTKQHWLRFSNAISRNWNSAFDVILQAKARTTACKVYDLKDTGPFHRFVVLGNDGPFIVHNCQHMARHVVMWQTAAINEVYPVALSVHDEVVCVVPEDQVDACVKYMTAVLSTAPAWCRDKLPVACEVGYGRSYGEAK